MIVEIRFGQTQVKERIGAVLLESSRKIYGSLTPVFEDVRKIPQHSQTRTVERRELARSFPIFFSESHVASLEGRGAGVIQKIGPRRNLGKKFLILCQRQLRLSHGRQGQPPEFAASGGLGGRIEGRQLFYGPVKALPGDVLQSYIQRIVVIYEESSVALR